MKLLLSFHYINQSYFYPNIKWDNNENENSLLAALVYSSNFINISKNFPHITIYNIDKLSPQSKKKYQIKRIKNYYHLTNLKKI